MADDNCAKTPINDLEKAALEHYDKLATAGHEWYSDIPKAIRAYYEAKRMKEFYRNADPFKAYAAPPVEREADGPLVKDYAPVPEKEVVDLNRDSKLYAWLPQAEPEAVAHPYGPPASAKYEQIAGMQVERPAAAKSEDAISDIQREKYQNVYDAITSDKSDVELSLLVIDLGDSCVVKVEKGDPSKVEQMIVGMQSTRTDGLFVVSVPFRGFQSIKDELDRIDQLESEKPVIPYVRQSFEANDEIDGYAVEIETGIRYIEPVAFEALTRIVEIPVWTPKAGKWERLPSTAEYMGDPLESVGIAIWRYTR